MHFFINKFLIMIGFVCISVLVVLVRTQENPEDVESITPTAECIEKGYCDETDLPNINYPHDVAKQLIKEHDLQPLVEELHFEPPTRRKQHFELHLCPHHETLRTLFAVPDFNMDWRYVINDVDKPIAKLRIQRCLKENSTCNEVVSMLGSYKTICVQQTVTRTMDIISNKKHHTWDLVLPSCCSCHYYK